MNITGLLIGIVMWVLVLCFMPSIPTWVRVIIAIIIAVLVLTLVSRVYRHLLTRDKP